MDKTDQLDVERVRKAVETSSLWTDLVYRKRVPSTNDVAKDVASRGAPAGTVVITDYQTAGRGRLERHWVAPPGSSLLLSILLRPDLQPRQTGRLTMLCSMAAADALLEVAGLSVRLKWPNDLVVPSSLLTFQHPRWCKLAGVLTEAGWVAGTPAFVVVGLGINVNVPAEALTDLAPDATSIMAETGCYVDRSTLVLALLCATEARYRRLVGGENPQGEWAARLMTLGRRVRAATREGMLHGVAEAVDEDGALLLRTDDGQLHRLLAGDVTLAEH